MVSVQPKKYISIFLDKEFDIENPYRAHIHLYFFSYIYFACIYLKGFETAASLYTPLTFLPPYAARMYIPDRERVGACVGVRHRPDVHADSAPSFYPGW